MKLLPCPFCEGPPVPSVVRSRYKGGGCFPDSELAGDDGLDLSAQSPQRGIGPCQPGYNKRRFLVVA